MFFFNNNKYSENNVGSPWKHFQKKILKLGFFIYEEDTKKESALF